MFIIIYRRLQKYAFWLKLLTLIVSLGGLGALIYYTPPLLPNVLGAVVLVFLILVIVLAFFINARLAFLASIAGSFLIFLRAVDLLTIVNVILLLAFLILLWFYFKKTPVEKSIDPLPPHEKKVLFPKGWPFRVK